MKMKYLALSTLLAGTGAQAGVILSNPASVPGSNIAVSQLVTTGSQNIQARQRGPGATGDWRAITETFQWTTSDAFDGIGLHMGTGNDALWTGASQTYQFVIQAITTDAANTPTQTVYNASFTLADANVADSTWLFIDTDDLALQNGVWYGFSLAPQEGATDAGLRTYWDTGSGDLYAGRARQYDPASGGGIPKTDGYGAGGGVNDYTFYMQSIPEPGTIGLVGLSAMGALFARRFLRI